MYRQVQCRDKLNFVNYCKLFENIHNISSRSYMYISTLSPAPFFSNPFPLVSEFYRCKEALTAESLEQNDDGQ